MSPPVTFARTRMTLPYSPRHGRSDAELLAHVSALYYHDGCTQKAIATRLRLSRQKVYRLLRAAREAGVARVVVRPPLGVLTTLESALEERYGLREVRVASVPSDDSPRSVRRRLGVTAAADLARTVRVGGVVGLAGGALIASMIDAAAPMRTSDVRVVQAVGWEHAPSAAPPLAELVRELARHIEGTAVVLPAPSVVASETARRYLEADQHIGEVLRALDTLDTLYVDVATGDSGITSVESTTDGPTPVGHIALHHFDRDGQILGPTADGHVVGITLEQLRRTRHVVGLAEGPAHASAIAAAMQTNLIHELITDELTARALAALPPHRERSAP